MASFARSTVAVVLLRSLLEYAYIGC